MPFRVLRHVLGRGAGRREETFGCRRTRRKKDKRIRIYRHSRTKAADSSRLPGATTGRDLSCHSTMERAVRKISALAKGKQREVNHHRREIRRRRETGVDSITYSCYGIE